MEVRALICISCPMGCKLMVSEDVDGSKELNVTGHGCLRGIKFANEEFYAPKRVITTVVSIEGEDMEFLPVISDGTISKEKVSECIQILKEIQVKRPVLLGEVIIKNILDTNVDILAAKTIKDMEVIS